MDALSTQIASRTFDTVKRGYDKRAVDAYLTRLGEQVGKLEDELRVVRSRLEVVEKQTRDVRDADTIVKTAFLAAAESKAKLIAEAESTATEIISAAEQRAETIAPVASTTSGEDAAAILLEAKRRLEDSERQARVRREEAELEARAIIASAKARVAEGGDEFSREETAAAAEELKHLVEALGALKEAAGSLGRAEKPSSDVESIVGNRSGDDPAST
jgi:cell division initiation protein